MKYCAVFGLIYDLIFTNTLIFNCVLFVIVALSIQFINIFISNGAFNTIIINLFAITIYRVVSYLFLMIIGYINHNFSFLLKGIYSSYLLNILFGFILYLITDYLSKKHRINKID
jgi:cell shape-determining protein MreD